MPSTSSESDTDAWRELLFGRSAWTPSERLRVGGLSVRLEAAPLDLVAEVLAEIHSEPMRLLDGEPIVRAQ